MTGAIRFTSQMTVQCIDSMGGDDSICRAARVSLRGVDSLQTDESYGLIRHLMRNKHGSPFEHGTLQFLIEAPIFVWREFMRHRIGFSYNEESARWKQLEPKFYLPGVERPAAQEGKPGEYRLARDPDLMIKARSAMQSNATDAYCVYESLLAQGVAREVARQVLPVSIFSSAYVTCNPRSLMSFLELRAAPTALHEIRKVAEQMEQQFQMRYPLTHRAWVEAGRVAP
jgi:thymidylate synthase (FAD)